jgi:hypothetical protein
MDIHCHCSESGSSSPFMSLSQFSPCHLHVTITATDCHSPCDFRCCLVTVCRLAFSISLHRRSLLCPRGGPTHDASSTLPSSRLNSSSGVFVSAAAKLNSCRAENAKGQRAHWGARTICHSPRPLHLQGALNSHDRILAVRLQRITSPSPAADGNSVF